MTTAGYVEAQSIVVPTAQTLTVTTNGGGPTTVTLTAGTFSLSQLLVQLAADLTAQRPVTAGAWSVTISKTGTSPTGKVTIAVSAGTLTIAWATTLIRDLLGFTVTLTAVASATAPNQAKGLWIPDVVLLADNDIKRFPLATDARRSISPRGNVYTLIGNSFGRISNVRWPMVVLNRVWTAEETTVNASYETFVKDVQLGLGHAWFSVGGAVRLFDHRSIEAGQDANGGTGTTSGWQVSQLPDPTELRMKQDGYTGLWAVVWPEITSPG